MTRSHNHNSSKNKQEAILVLANIIKRSSEQDQLKYLVDQNLLDMIHNELISGGDQEIFSVIALQCLDMVFTNLPNQRDLYL